MQKTQTKHEKNITQQKKNKYRHNFFDESSASPLQSAFEATAPSSEKKIIHAD